MLLYMRRTEILSRADVMVEVCLCYPWQPSVNIYYTIAAVS